MSKMIQIRQVPDALHRALKVRAAQPMRFAPSANGGDRSRRISLGALLLTLDERLARSRGHRTRVELVA